MALTAKVDDTTSPITLTVTSDRRRVGVTVAGETIVATFPVHIVDPSGRTWTMKTDDGAVAVYTG